MQQPHETSPHCPVPLLCSLLVQTPCYESAGNVPTCGQMNFIVLFSPDLKDRVKKTISEVTAQRFQVLMEAEIPASFCFQWLQPQHQWYMKMAERCSQSSHPKAPAHPSLNQASLPHMEVQWRQLQVTPGCYEMLGMLLKHYFSITLTTAHLKPYRNCAHHFLVELEQLFSDLQSRRLQQRTSYPGSGFQ